MSKVYYQSQDVRGFNLNEPTLCFSHLHNFLIRAIRKNIIQATLDDDDGITRIKFSCKGKDYISVKDASTYNKFCYLYHKEGGEEVMTSNMVCIRLFNELSGMFYSKVQGKKSWRRKYIVKPLISTK